MRPNQCTFLCGRTVLLAVMPLVGSWTAAFAQRPPIVAAASDPNFALNRSVLLSTPWASAECVAKRVPSNLKQPCAGPLTVVGQFEKPVDFFNVGFRPDERIASLTSTNGNNCGSGSSSPSAPAD